MGIRDRLTKIDDRVSKISRRLGLLEARVFFKIDGKEEEVPIFEFSDNGKSPQTLKSGDTVEIHSYGIRINRLWYDQYQGRTGSWYVIRFEGAPKVPCSASGEVFQDADTAVSLTLQVDQHSVEGYPLFY